MLWYWQCWKCTKAYTRRVFRKCMKTFANYENRLAYFNRKTIETRRYIMSLTMLYNIFHKYIACNILDSFTAPAHNRNWRVHHYKLFVPFCKTNIRKNVFYQFGTFYKLKLLDLMFVLHIHIVKINLTLHHIFI